MYGGSIVALVTPMRPNGDLDFESLARLVEFHVDNGTDAIVAVGTTGESATLSVEEHVEVVRRVVRLAAGRLPVIAGTGGNSTADTVALTRRASAEGANACLLVTPYYNKPTQEGLYRHYRTVAEAVPVPLILYNVPGRTACDMKPETVARLADLPNIVGLKEASGSLERNRELLALLDGRIALLSGDDDLACESIAIGFRGVISVTANVVPHQMHTMCAAALAGDLQQARRVNGTLRPLHKALFLESNPIPVKWALARLGLIEDSIRLPLTPLSRGFHVPLLEAMQEAGIAFA